MPTGKLKRPRSVDQPVIGHVSSLDDADRMIDEVARKVTPVQTRRRISADLVVGANRVTHNLGRRPEHVSLMPTVADASFAWAVTARNDKWVTVTIAGVDQPGASLEVF